MHLGSSCCFLSYLISLAVISAASETTCREPGLVQFILGSKVFELRSRLCQKEKRVLQVSMCKPYIVQNDWISLNCLCSFQQVQTLT